MNTELFSGISVKKSANNKKNALFFEKKHS